MRQIDFRFTLVRILVCALYSVGLLSGALAGDPVEALQERLRAIDTFQGDFTQTVYDGRDQVTQYLEGQLVIAKPFRFFWKTKDPFPQTITSNGERVWIFDQDLSQVQVRDLSTELAPTPAALLGGSVADIAKYYQVKQLVSDQDGFSVYELTPLNQGNAGDFESVKLVFQRAIVTEIQLLDGLGQKTIIRIQQPQMNEQVDRQLFEFQIPEGVDVIDETGYVGA